MPGRAAAVAAGMTESLPRLPRLAAGNGFEPLQERPGGENRNAVDSPHDQQVAIPGHDTIGVSPYRRFENHVVVGVATPHLDPPDRDDLGNLAQGEEKVRLLGGSEVPGELGPTESFAKLT